MNEKRYIADELRPDGHWYAVHFIAANENEAIAFCERNGFKFGGAVHAIIPIAQGTSTEEAAEALDAATAKLNQRGTQH